jgi:hypothetical protein
MKTSKENLEKRIEVLNKVSVHLLNASVVLQEEGENLTKGELNRATLNVSKLLGYIEEEVNSATSTVEKAKVPSMSAKLKALKEKFSEEEIDELLKEKGVEL